MLPDTLGRIVILPSPGRCADLASDIVAGARGRVGIRNRVARGAEPASIDEQPAGLAELMTGLGF